MPGGLPEEYLEATNYLSKMQEEQQLEEMERAKAELERQLKDAHEAMANAEEK